jgi:uncharacterized protein
MQSLDRPLSDQEFETLAALIAQVDDGDIADIEALDGFLTALAVCPELVPPSEFLGVIQSGADEDGDLVFEDMDEAQAFVGLVMRHWNNINRTLAKDEPHMPVLLEDAAGVAHGNNWANGFLRGMRLREPAWNAMVNDEERGGPFIPIFALACEHHPDPEMRPYTEPMSPERRETLQVGMIAGVLQLYRSFANDRRRSVVRGANVVPLRPKVGRNDPCPCGSGKKYKKCCGLH